MNHRSLEREPVDIESSRFEEAAHAKWRPKPLFLFSLPRSGSTLTQRILGAHEQIATVSEPWILLPYLYTLRDRGVFAEYHHRASTEAIRDFCEALPGGREDYLLEIREFALRLYSKASRGSVRYFLDKTPRYHLIADEVISMFPEGKFLFLWRNPLAVVASIMDTWAGGRWNLYGYKIDLFEGLENLIRTYEKHGDRVHAVRYEEFTERPAEVWTGVFDYLGLPFDPLIVRRFSDVDLGGEKGDPTGTGKYRQVSREPLEKWKCTLANPMRRAWCRRYLRWIGADRLAVMGYTLDGLLAELDAVPASLQHLGSDALRAGYGQACELFEPRMLKHKLRTLSDWKRIHAHR